MGDLSEPCDDYVNITDFSAFALAYGSWIEGANYNPCADFNGDGFVDVTDSSQFAAYYGVPCP